MSRHPSNGSVLAGRLARARKPTMRVGAMTRFRLEFADDGSTIDVHADDFDDDGEQVTLYRYTDADADPLATGKEIIASFDRSSLLGPPRSVD